MCGIAGIINPVKQKFQKHEFEILGIINDERGGDSCGIYIDGYCQKGLGKYADFRDFTPTIEYPKESKIAFVHDRATSVGLKTNLEQCQPVVLTEDGVDKFVLMHNGTIANAKDLAAKYIPTIDIKGYSDSMIMANIFYNCGYDVLAEYTGTAAFAIVDYRTDEPEILFWTGSSCYNSRVEDYYVERQLYYSIKDDGTFIFSSIKAGLYLITNTEIKSFAPNYLFKFTNKELVIVKEIDRTKLTINNKSKKKNKNNIWSSDDNLLLPSYGNYATFHTNSRTINGYVKYVPAQHIYVSNGEPLHGVYNIWESGYISGGYLKSSNSREFAFWHGRLLLSSKHFDLLKYYLDLIGDESLFYSYCSDIIDYCCYEPVKCSLSDTMDFVGNSFIYYNNTMKFVSLFPAKIWDENGKQARVIGYKKALEAFDGINKIKTLTIDELRDQIHKLMVN